MSKIVMDVSMSLDGFSAGPNVRDEEPMGDGGERLHGWTTGIDGAAVHQEANAAVGAVLVGRRTFDVGLRQWGGTPWPGVPTFVVTHRTREDLLGDNGGTFAFDGLEAAAGVPRMPRETMTSWCWVQSWPRDCSGRACSTRCVSTSFPC